MPTSTRSSINKNVPVDVPIVGDAGRVLEALLAAWKADADAAATRQALTAWWRRSTPGAPRTA